MLIVLALVGAPVLVLMLLRISATMVFLGLCLGYVVMQFLGGDAQSFASLFTAHATVSTSVMKLVLLLFPAVFTALFMIHTVRGARLLLNLLPALAVGCLTALLVVPLLPSGLAHGVSSLALWHQVTRLQDLIVGAGALVSLLLLWTQRPRQGGDHSRHHRAAD